MAPLTTLTLLSVLMLGANVCSADPQTPGAPAPSKEASDAVRGNARGAFKDLDREAGAGAEEDVPPAKEKAAPVPERPPEPKPAEKKAEAPLPRPAKKPAAAAPAPKKPAGPATNLALNKPARQSSTSVYSHPNDAQGAVDGVKTGQYGFHTENEAKPWWEVDLLAPSALDEIRVFNRLNNSSERAAKLMILLSDDDKEWRKVYAHSGPVFGGTDGHPLVVPLKGEKARYVRLQLDDTTWFHLDEVEIYGWPDS